MPAAPMLSQTLPPAPSANATDPRPVSVACLVVGAVAMGLAIQQHYGMLDLIAGGWLSVALAAVLVGLFWRIAASREAVLVLITAGLAVQIGQMLDNAPTVGIFTPDQQAMCGAILIAGATVYAAGLFFFRIRTAALVGVLTLHVLLGTLLIRTFPNPHIDVYFFIRDAGSALLHGHNPYAVVYRDIYWPHSQKAYGPGVSVNGWLRYGCPYPPIPILAALPGLLVGDYRYAYLLAITATGALIATMGRPRRISISVRKTSSGALDPIAFASSALLLFLPAQGLVLQMGWVEPVTALLLAATVWTGLRHPRWLALPLGLLLVSKQYMILAAPAVWLLLPTIPAGRRVRTLAMTALVGAVACVPLAIVGGRRFWQGVVVWQFHQPFRTDALSYPAWVVWLSPHWAAWLHVEQLAPIFGFAAAGLAIALCLRFLPRNPAGFAATVGITLMAFFAFNKQAFCNYYYLVVASLCTAIAAQRTIAPATAPRQIPPRAPGRGANCKSPQPS